VACDKETNVHICSYSGGLLILFAPHRHVYVPNRGTLRTVSMTK